MTKLKYDNYKIHELRINNISWKEIAKNFNSTEDAVRASYSRWKCKNDIKNNIKRDVFKICIVCGKIILNSSDKYCSFACQHEFQFQEWIKSWKIGNENGIKGKYGISNYLRKYLFRKYNNKCSKCGWGKVNPYSNKIPLEIEHIDGNYLNNNEDNLELLCPNCHSLTKTYKGANKGNGRKERRKYNL